MATSKESESALVFFLTDLLSQSEETVATIKYFNEEEIRLLSLLQNEVENERHDHHRSQNFFEYDILE